MAKQVITNLVDDLDGGVAHETVRFSLDGTEYEIDLSTKNAKRLRASLTEYVNVGSRVPSRPPSQGGRSRPGQRRPASPPPLTGSKAERGAIRAWASSKGIDVAERGRIKAEIMDAYRQAMGG